MDVGTSESSPLKVEQVPPAFRGVAAALLFMFAVRSLVTVIGHPPPGTGDNSRVLYQLVLVCAAVGSVSLIWSVMKYSVVVWPDRIEYTNGFITKTLMRTGVRGYRENIRARHVRLIPADENQRPLTV